MTNKNLQLAKSQKNDEFYTQFEDIQREIDFFLGFNKKLFWDKSILLPCDNPETSQFAKFFLLNFRRLGLKCLICTSLARKNVEGRSLENLDFADSLKYGRRLVVTRDLKNGGLCVRDEKLNSNGDFRNKEIGRLLESVDFVITNPPFSLFREFLDWLVESGKAFLIIGCLNSVSCKNIFRLFKDNKIWFGLDFLGNNAFFQIPQDCIGYTFDGNGLVKFRNIAWFTNIEHPHRHRRLDLRTMSVNLERFKFKRKATFLYKKYDNYEAIEIPLLEAIPSDYFGVMGVPVSFLNKFCPEQFEILNANDYRTDLNHFDFSSSAYFDMVARPRINGINIYRRVFIKAIKRPGESFLPVRSNK